MQKDCIRFDTRFNAMEGNIVLVSIRTFTIVCVVESHVRMFTTCSHENNVMSM